MQLLQEVKPIKTTKIRAFSLCLDGLSGKGKAQKSTVFIIFKITFRE